LIFFDLISIQRKEIYQILNDYLFLTGAIVITYGFFYYIDSEFIEVAALKNVWSNQMELERDVFYFSGVTYFTIGYGDIIPIKPISKLAALSEAMIGAAINIIAIGIAIKNLDIKLPSNKKN
jgi:hypothetical protein